MLGRCFFSGLPTRAASGTSTPPVLARVLPSTCPGAGLLVVDASFPCDASGVDLLSGSAECALLSCFQLSVLQVQQICLHGNLRECGLHRQQVRLGTGRPLGRVFRRHPCHQVLPIWPKHRCHHRHRHRCPQQCCRCSSSSPFAALLPLSLGHGMLRNQPCPQPLEG